MYYFSWSFSWMFYPLEREKYLNSLCVMSLTCILCTAFIRTSIEIVNRRYPIEVVIWSFYLTNFSDLTAVDSYVKSTRKKEKDLSVMCDKINVNIDDSICWLIYWMKEHLMIHPVFKASFVGQNDKHHEGAVSELWFPHTES